MCPSVGTRGLSVPQCVGTTGGGGKVECTKCGD